MACRPADFCLKTMSTTSCYSSRILGPKTRATWTCFFSCSAEPDHVLFWKRCIVNVVETGQSSNGVGESPFAMYLENTLSKDKNIHPL